METTKEYKPNSSIELNLTSTGKVSYSVKAYGETPQEIKNNLSEMLKIANMYKEQMGMNL